MEKGEDWVKSHTIFIGDSEGNIGQESKAELVEEEKYAGLYKVRGHDHGEITIVNDRTLYLIHFLSVLAHEVTHNYLYHHQVTAPGWLNSEILTDLAAIYLGFGNTILRGYEPSSAISCRLGYIDVSTIRSAIQQASLLRDRSVNGVSREFPWFDGFYSQLHLLLKKIFKTFPQSQSKREANQETSEKRIILCDACGQKLRVPKKATFLKVTCPKCGSFFMIDNNGNKI